MTDPAADKAAALGDPFGPARRDAGVLAVDFAGEAIPMILGHRAVRAAARDWQTFSSDAPGRVPIPEETAVRSVRQLPIETDPPVHKAWRDLLKPTFLRPAEPDYIAAIDALVARAIDAAVAAGEIEVVRGFALPLQSRALTLLLGLPETEAEEWIGWGVHVFHDGDDAAARGAGLDGYIRARIAAARAAPGEDFFGAMTRMAMGGRPLADDEMAGIANLVFAGGRDTVITAVAAIIAWFAGDRAALDRLCADPRRIPFAVEEFVRATSPLTHIGRVCPQGAEIGGQRVAPNARVSLCWASANFDETVFDAPHDIRLDRAPNPHLGFGSGHHNCLGAAHARALLRSLVRQLGERTRAITVLAAEPGEERYGNLVRTLGYHRLTVRIDGA